VQVRNQIHAMQLSDHGMMFNNAWPPAELERAAIHELLCHFL
jgi:hypothetical protein